MPHRRSCLLWLSWWPRWPRRFVLVTVVGAAAVGEVVDVLEVGC